eukprot:11505439-Prorocentrum_lima.AAC.1
MAQQWEGGAGVQPALFGHVPAALTDCRVPPPESASQTIMLLPCQLSGLVRQARPKPVKVVLT